MAFDGITVSNIVKELNDTLMGGRIYKIAQPEADELLLTIKNNGGQYRVLCSANASLPLVYLTDHNKPSPMTAPNFCMLLRKHIQNGRILSIRQPGLERIIHFEIEHLNELGDLCRKLLIIEIMGKHSNIIFCDDSGMILDSIKHVSGMMSSVREVLPGRTYFIPQTQDKLEPLSTGEPEFYTQLSIDRASFPVFKAIYSTFTGLSPILSQELCVRAGVDGDRPAGSLNTEECHRLWLAFDDILSAVRNGSYEPNIVYERKEPVEFSPLRLSLYKTSEAVFSVSISQVLETYYAQRSAVTRIRQKSVDLRKVVQTALERNVKKYDLQIKQMQDTEKKDKYRIYGELLNTYGYDVTPGSNSLEALNYYTNEMITIPLDTTLTPSKNAKKYFDKYGKLKRTYEALSELTVHVKEEIEHLKSVSTALDIALLEEDLVQIKEELIENGYIRRKGPRNQKKVKITSSPFHYLSSDGYHIYVGKNNFQNEELTFKFASGNDWWFHAKGIPGSHVIIKSGSEELPNKTFEEAGRLAAHYSAGRGQDKVEIDYVEKKHVKKPGGGKPGFVVYYTNYSLLIDSDITGITEVK